MSFHKRFKNIILIAFIFSSTINISFSQNRDLGVTINFKEDNKEQQFKLYEESYALVIGASNYISGNGWATLPGVKNDITTIREILEMQGFKVTVVENPDSVTLKKSYEDFINNYGLNEENRLLFYFAGHGYTLKQSYKSDMGYIVPIDAPNPDNDKKGFLQKALNMQQIEVYAKNIQSKHALFIFDSCFSGSIFALSRDRSKAISYKTAQPVRQFITSGSAEESVPDKSLFREQFVMALKGEADFNNDGFVTGSELGVFLQDNVINYSKESQHPQYGKIRDQNLDKGDFVFEMRKAIIENPVATAIIPQHTPSSPDELKKMLEEAKKKQDAEKSRITEEEKRLALAKDSFDKAKKIDESSYLSKDQKIKAWQSFLNDFKSTGYQTNYAEERINHWNIYKAEDTPTPQPPPTYVSSQTQKEQTETFDLGNGVKLEMVYIRGGSFQMGSNNGDSDEKPVHTVSLADFWMGKYEVTQGQWQAIMGNNPSGFKGSNLPVERVSWNDCKEFIGKLNSKTGKNFNLPSEAQWEYACRAGSTTRFCFGDSDSGLGDYAWYTSNSGNKTHPVGRKKPNTWGLYDIHGNVWEWCEDWHHDSYGGAPADGSAWLSPASSLRVLRGGAWCFGTVNCRSADRGWSIPSGSGNDLGFRVIKSK